MKPLWSALAIALGCVGAILVASFALAQAVPQSPPLPSSYTFTLSVEQTDTVYQALERASLIQSLATGERSARFDALEALMRDRVAEQKAAAAKVAEASKPKDEAKP